MPMALDDLISVMILGNLLANAAAQAMAGRRGLSFEELQAIFDRKTALNAEWAQRLPAHGIDAVDAGGT